VVLAGEKHLLFVVAERRSGLTRYGFFESIASLPQAASFCPELSASGLRCLLFQLPGDRLRQNTSDRAILLFSHQAQLLVQVLPRLEQVIQAVPVVSIRCGSCALQPAVVERLAARLPTRV
jgi:hypothetical protein